MTTEPGIMFCHTLVFQSRVDLHYRRPWS